LAHLLEHIKNRMLPIFKPFGEALLLREAPGAGDLWDGAPRHKTGGPRREWVLMGEICILHAPETWESARHVAAALAAEGHSVFRRETTASNGDQNGADAVIVIWSPAVLASSAAIDAARRALARRILVPVALGAVEPPPSFAHVWPIDLSGWEGDRNDPRWQFVRDEIDLATRRNEPASEPFPAEERMNWSAPTLPSVPMRWAVPAVVGFAAIVAGAAILLVPRGVDRAVDLERPAVAMVDPNREEVASRTPNRSAAERDPAAEAPARTQSPEAPSSEAPATQAGASEREPQPTERVAEAKPAIPPPPINAAATKNAPETNDRPVAVPLDAKPEQPTELAAAEPVTKPARQTAPEAPVPQTPDEAEAAAEEEGLAEGDEDPTLRASAEETAAGEGGQAPVEPAAEPTQIASLEPIQGPAVDSFSGAVFRDCADCPDMVEIPAGDDELLLGDHNGVVFVETGAKEPFALSRREVTFDEWAACVAEGACRPLPDAGWGRGQRPAIHPSFDDALAYVSWLSAKTGRQYRLPTEVEWVHAAGPSFAEERANIDGGPGVSRGRTTPAGSFAPSAYGLFDMRGNVWEWVADCSPAAEGGADCSRHIVKGGAWNAPPLNIAAQATAVRSAGEGGPDVGFRVARDLP
jgi:hypothetical protein